MPASDQGASAHRYTIIPRTLIFLTYQDQVLLIKGAPNKRLWANRYNGIGGHVERGEDILGAAIREVYEETGAMPSNLWLCGLVTIDTGEDCGIGLYVFRGQVPDPTRLTLESGEGKLEWFSPDEIYQLALVEDLPTLLPRVLAMDPEETLFYASYHYDSSGDLQISFRN